MGKKRSLVSLKMCVISWLIELLSSLVAVSFTVFHNMGLHNMHFLDCIIVNIIIPFVHLMNDEETKGIIAKKNWYAGLRHMLGIYKETR